MKKLALFLTITTALFSNTSIKSIDMFNNQTFVNQVLPSSSNQITLLGVVRAEDLRFSLSEGCQIKNFDVEYQDFQKDDLTIKIKQLEETINSHQNRIKALQSNIAFLEKSSVTHLTDANILKNTSTFLKQEVQLNYNEIFSVEKELKPLNEELNELHKKRANSKFTQLEYTLQCDKNARVSYPIHAINKNSFYDIHYNTNTQQLQLSHVGFITQSTGVDFKDIDINLYTYSYSNQLKPNRFIPEYLDIQEAKNRVYAQAEMAMDAVPMQMARVQKAQPSFEYKEDTTKAFFKASHIDLISGQKSEVLFAKDTYKAKHGLEIDGYSSSQAFFKVDFKSDKLYGISNAKLFLDGTYIGRSFQDEIKKEKQNTLYFATNRFIDIKKELMQDMKEEQFFGSKQENQKIWKYEITNNSTQTQTLTLLERVPVSKHEAIEIKLIGKSKESKMDKNGKIHFDFVLQPKETKIIEFGYEIQRPKKD